MPEKAVSKKVDQPLVTAVMTTYSRANMAKRAIQSIISQTYHPMEIIVVEDGSTSDIEEWIRINFFSNIKYILNSQNRGLAAARNTGLKNSHGKYVAYLDDDDEWLPDKIARQIEMAERRTDAFAVIYCGACVASANDKVVSKNKPRLRGNIREAVLTKGLYTIPSSCLFRREVLTKIGGYDENLLSHVDHDIWLKLARENYSSDYVNKCLVKVNPHDQPQMTKDVRRRIEATKAFCQKWEPELMSWFGRKRGKLYCSRFKARVMAMLARDCLHSGKKTMGWFFFLRAVRHDPFNPSYRDGLLISGFGKTFYDRFSCFLKNVKGALSFLK